MTECTQHEETEPQISAEVNRTEFTLHEETEPKISAEGNRTECTVQKETEQNAQCRRKLGNSINQCRGNGPELIEC
jgi:hypothetical protein